jgi:hypothetical protein
VATAAPKSRGSSGACHPTVRRPSVSAAGRVAVCPPHRCHEPERLTSRCRDRLSLPFAWIAPPNRGSPSSACIHGTHVSSEGAVHSITSGQQRVWPQVADPMTSSGITPHLVAGAVGVLRSLIRPRGYRLDGFVALRAPRNDGSRSTRAIKT